MHIKPYKPAIWSCDGYWFVKLPDHNAVAFTSWPYAVWVALHYWDENLSTASVFDWLTAGRY